MNTHGLDSTRVRRSARSRRVSISLTLLLVTSAVLAESNGSVPSASGGPYVLEPTRVAGGARTLTGGTFSLVGTAGQHDAQVVSAQGGGYDVVGGYHPASSARPAVLPQTIFGNGFE
ncbi:MAG: hypothetical protein ABIP49_04435 [Lysobacterales bacterium]